MSSAAPDSWLERVRQTLHAYDEPLLRTVATKLCKPRNQWPAAELIDRCLATFDNPAMLDRRLKDLEPAARQALTLITMSGQPRWPVGSLVEMLITLGAADGLAPVQTLLEAGLLYPELPTGGAKTKVRHFDTWLAQQVRPTVYAPPALTERCGGEPLPIDVDSAMLPGPAREADGLEWPLRLAVAWQQAATMPFRRTQQRGFFKRDLERLRGDTLLNAAPADPLVELPDLGLLVAAWGAAAGLLHDVEGELRAGTFSSRWNGPLSGVIAELWSALPALAGWDTRHGGETANGPGHPYPSTYLLAVAALTALPENAWAKPETIDRWIAQRHPYWQSAAPSNGEPRKRGADKSPPSCGAAAFLLGVVYPLRMVDVAKDKAGAWHVRLSALGRWILGLGDTAPSFTTFPQTLLVQPNLEILAYRQGLTPDLIVKLTHFARWQTLGAACTLHLEPASVYRALEAGESYGTITQLLDRHGMKPTPTPVLDALKTWSNKRDRISVWPEAVLLEFPGPAELNDAIARGLPAMRLTDRLAAVARESLLDYKHFRLIGARDYCLPPEKCVDVEADGVTLSVDPARSDLMLETEIQRFAEPAAAPASGGNRRVYRITPASLHAAKRAGVHLDDLALWFQQRTGLPLSPAAKMLLTGAEAPPPELRRQLVLHVLNPELADGLLQWPTTAALIQARLGPTTIAVAERDAEMLQQRLHELGIRLVHGEG
jgi:hypothetical protein